MLSTFLVVFLVSSAVAQVPFLGPCPKVEVVSNFTLDSYLGKWYEAEKYFAIFELGGKCVTANYTINDNGTVGVLNRQISSLSGISSSIEGVARLAGDPDEGKLAVTFPSVPFAAEAPYWVLDTDYDSYAVVYSCIDFGVFNTRIVWILTRIPRAPIEVVEKAYAAIDKNRLSRAYLIRTDQKNCPVGN